MCAGSMVPCATTLAGPWWTHDRDRAARSPAHGAASMEGGSSPREHLEKEGAEGNLTVGEGG
jgi:hypothetical protein